MSLTGIPEAEKNLVAAVPSIVADAEQKVEQAADHGTADLKGLVDHFLAGLDALLSKYTGKKLTITVQLDDKDKSS